jgi:hypothetical protein
MKMSMGHWHGDTDRGKLRYWGMKMSMGHWCGDTDRGKLRYRDMKNLSHCHFAINVPWTDQGSNLSLRGEKHTLRV